ncbi:MAG: ATP-binding protein, partial [Ignisphaera sp.]
MGLFDLRPKTSREELFDREKELEELCKAIDRGNPLIAVLGIRRIGKTSLLRTFLNETTGLYIDMRGILKEYELWSRIGDSFSLSINKLKRFIESIRGITVAGINVEIKWKGRDSVSFIGLLEEINKRKEKFAVVLDEVQSTKPPLSAMLRNAIAYAYDNLENIVFIVAGSEIGMLQNFLKLEDPTSPLYSRHTYDIIVERFTRDLAKEFLLKGFKEEGVEPSADVVEDALNFFDGIVGWLVLFGRKYVEGVRNFDNLKNIAIELAQEELKKLNPREKIVLKAI